VISPVFAGKSCEHKATTICTKGVIEPIKPHSFCVNGGTCAREVASGERHPGCICPHGWDGPHCEVRIQVNKSEQNEDDTSDSDLVQGKESENEENNLHQRKSRLDTWSIVIYITCFIALVVAVVAVVISITIFYGKRRGRGHSIKSITFFTGGRFRDELSEITNVVLASDKHVDPVPKRSFSSSVDKIVYGMAYSDSTPEASNTSIQYLNRKKGHQFSCGMESSDTTPEANGGSNGDIEPPVKIRSVAGQAEFV